MGLNINDLWSQGVKAAEQGFNDFWRTGSSAVTAYLEDQAIKIISADKKRHESNFQSNINDILQRPSSPDGIGAYISNQLQSPVLKNYGVPIMVAVGIVGLGAILLYKK